MGKVAGYTTRKGKRVRSYTRRGGPHNPHYLNDLDAMLGKISAETHSARRRNISAAHFGYKPDRPTGATRRSPLALYARNRPAGHPLAGRRSGPMHSNSIFRRRLRRPA